MNDNRKAFLRDRTTFWGPGRTRSGMFAGLVRDPNRLSPKDIALGRRSLGRIKMELSRAQKNGMERVVISEENMIGTMMKNFAHARLYGQAGQRLSRFAPAFGGHRLRIGIAIRSYETYWASALAFRIKNGNASPHADMLDRLTTQPRRWRHVIEDAARAFPEAEINVWSFEAWASQPDQQLRSLTGRHLPPDIRVGRIPNNASLTAAEIGTILRARGHHQEATVLEHQIGRFQPFSPAQVHKLRQDYANDIDWLIDGSDGLATYFDPTGETSGVAKDARGSTYDRQERLGRARDARVARPLAG